MKKQSNPDTELLDVLQELVYSSRKQSLCIEIPTYCGTQMERTDAVTLSWDGAPDVRWAIGKLVEVYSR